MQRLSVRAKFLFEGDRKFFIKGVTYGPFAPGADGEHFGNPEKAGRDFELMTGLGINLVRVYYPPPGWFVHLCEERGLRILVTIPWAEHVDFLNDRKVRREVVRTVRRAVGKHAGRPSILGYLVGNEIPTQMARWLGVQRVTEFIENLVATARDADPSALFSYASYPPTEYLLPENVDFLTFNVYLHNQEDFERYLARLQNLGTDKPLLLGETGMDTIRHTEAEQAEMLRWHVQSVVRGGLAGTIIFSWTDEWYRGGAEITDWAFGLVTRERRKKLACDVLEPLLRGDNATADSITKRVPLPSYPKVSVLVCSYNGGKTLEACLESLRHLNYPNYEVVLVDDGSTDNTPEIAARFPEVKTIRQPNMGLSHARNVAAAESTGDVLAYTDSDCMADPDWLYFLVGTLLSGDYAGVGGPNISPPAANWIQACVAAAPGGPSHVLLSDVVAEHIPGCNMAFHRWAFEKVGGFDTEYRKAGDDVDFCWRLQQEGQVIAFSPAAIVWHYRRFTLKAFRKQQEGYGEAESLLRFKHLIFFGPTGTARWKGQIYGAPRFSWFISKPVVYHGVFGSGLFQSIYPAPQSEIAAYLSSIEWVVLTCAIFLLALELEWLKIVPYLMIGGTFLVALSYMVQARIEPRYDTVPARLLVMFLAFAQPLVRGWARYFTWWKFKRTPASVITTPEAGNPSPLRNPTRLAYWSETGIGRDELLREVIAALEAEGWSYSTDTGWQNWDLHIYGNFWWSVTVRTVTEYHGGPKCLTRVRLKSRMVVTTLLVNMILLGIVAYRQFAIGLEDWWLILGYAVFVAWLLARAHRLKQRVGQLIDAAAHRCGLRTLRKKPRAKAD